MQNVGASSGIAAYSQLPDLDAVSSLATGRLVYLYIPFSGVGMAGRVSSDWNCIHPVFHQMFSKMTMFDGFHAPIPGFVEATEPYHLLA